MSRFLQKSLYSQNLFIAASSGELSSVQEQHLQRGHIDCYSFQGQTPLKAALNSGNDKVMESISLFKELRINYAFLLLS